MNETTVRDINTIFSRYRSARVMAMKKERHYRRIEPPGSINAQEIPNARIQILISGLQSPASSLQPPVSRL
jgi:hypothetical protein